HRSPRGGDPRRWRDLAFRPLSCRQIANYDPKRDPTTRGGAMVGAKAAPTALSALVLIGILTSPPSASPPTDEQLVPVQDASTYETLGWTATGTFADEGAWTVDRIIFGAANTLLFGDVETTEVGANGSFRLSFHGGTNPPGHVAAPWRISSGTGGY